MGICFFFGFERIGLLVAMAETLVRQAPSLGGEGVAAHLGSKLAPSLPSCVGVNRKRWRMVGVRAAVSGDTRF